MPQLQITTDHQLDETIRSEAKKHRLTLSSYARQLLVQALQNSGVTLAQMEVPKEQLPLLKEIEMN